MKRISEYYSLDKAMLTLNHRRDARLVIRAVEAMTLISNDGDLWSFRDRRLPHPSHRNTAVDESLTFLDEEAGLVIKSLSSYTKGLEHHPLTTLRAQSLIGGLVIAAGPAILAPSTISLPNKPSLV